MRKANKQNERAVLEGRFVHDLLALGSSLVRTGGRIVAKYGISQQQSVILIAVKEQGPVSQKGLRTALLHERSNVSKAVGRLSALGLVRTRKSSEDRRVMLLETTPKGRAMAEACMTDYDDWNRAWLKDFSDRELSVTLRLLERLMRAEAELISLPKREQVE